MADENKEYSSSEDDECMTCAHADECENPFVCPIRRKYIESID